MNFSSILSEVVGNSAASAQGRHAATSTTGSLTRLSNNIPGGLAGGAVAGGLVAMLVGSKSARKTAGKAAKYGGAAIIGGLAYKAYKGWQAGNVSASASRLPGAQPPQNTEFRTDNIYRAVPAIENFEREALMHSHGDVPQTHQLILLQAMIAAARADGQIDEDERARISKTINQMNMDDSVTNEMLNLFLKPIAIEDFAHKLETVEQKAEVYLVSCMAINLDQEAEYAHLSALSRALDLPAGLEQQLRAHAANAVSVAA